VESTARLPEFARAWAAPLLATLVLALVAGGVWVVYRKRDRRLADSAISQLLGRLALARCDCYVFWLSLSMPVRRAVVNSALVAVAVALVPLLLEILAMVWGKELVNFHLPVWLQAVIVGAATLLVRHRYHEWKRLGERSHFTTAMRFVFREIGALNFDDCVREEEKRLEKLDNFITNVLGAFHEVYKERLDATLNIMAMTSAGDLKIQYVYPPNTTYDPKAAFAPGQGAAGTAYEKRQLVYVPAIRYRHGISVVLPRPAGTGVSTASNEPTLELAENVYIPVDLQPFKGLLAVPISTADGECYGVLNLDSNVQNPFNDTDMEIADAAASAIGLGVDRFRASA
jgi:hypothetical protein